ncbi:hypothetical protein DFH09DRAFT_1407609 [Mycena vulgaris]|nr:hypothetical protein DFH09DRAFT_1407609 [Mycena vulgaris]
MSTMKDEGKHGGHGKRKVPPQWREMKIKGRERRRETKMKHKSLTAKRNKHVIHALPPHTLIVVRLPPAAKALEVERELHVRTCTPKSHGKWRGRRGSSPRTRCMGEDAWQQNAGLCSSWGRRHWSPSPSWGTNTEDELVCCGRPPALGGSGSMKYFTDTKGGDWWMAACTSSLLKMGIWFWKYPLVPWNSLIKLKFPAGAGKTVLTSMVVDHLIAACRNNRDIGVACIYLNHKGVDNQTPSKLLAAIWRQLVLNRDISSDAKELYKQHYKRGTPPSLQETAGILSSSLKEFSQVFIVIDAIDEYPEDQRFILLKHLTEQMGLSLSVNLMVTSRPHVPAGPTLPNVETLEISAMPEDIVKFVNAQIDSSSRLSKHVQRQPKLQQDIHSKISSKSVDGMFLLAKLHIDSLSTKNTIREVREALNALPEDLYGSYDIAIQRIDAQSNADRKTAHSTITWVVNAKRPLTVEELQVALAVKPGMQKLDEEEDLADIDIILSVCAGLVIVDKESSVVRLVHYTTQEYLDSIQAQKFPDAQTEITRTLLTFLAFDGYPNSSWNLENLPPLVEYSHLKFNSEKCFSGFLVRLFNG